MQHSGFARTIFIFQEQGKFTGCTQTYLVHKTIIYVDQGKCITVLEVLSVVFHKIKTPKAYMLT